jgi:hypothetical protein
MAHEAVPPLRGTTSPVVSQTTLPPPVPSMAKVTDPVGDPVDGLVGSTVAVKVTD